MKRSRFLPILAGLVLLPACPWGKAAGQPNPNSTTDGSPRNELDLPRLIKAWTEDLGALQSTREHIEFLTDNKVPILIVDATDDAQYHAVAAFAGGKVFVSRLQFVEPVRMLLMEQGVQEEEMPEILAHRTVHLIAHEIRHAMTHSQIKSEMGMDFPCPLFEDEVISWVDEAKVLAEAASRWPELAKYSIGRFQSEDKALSDAWKDGLDQVKVLISHLDEVPSLLSTSDQKFADDRNEIAGATRKIYEQMRSAKDMLNSLDPIERKKAADALRKLPSEEELARRLARTNACKQFVSDLQRMDKLSDYYKRRYQEIQDSWVPAQ